MYYIDMELFSKKELKLMKIANILFHVKIGLFILTNYLRKQINSQNSL